MRAFAARTHGVLTICAAFVAVAMRQFSFHRAPG
jgi:hypothetical protein